jgi:hypothetical protein
MLRNRLAIPAEFADITPMKRGIRTRTNDAETDRFHSASRAHVAQMAAQGRGRETLAEGARLLGIDISKPVDFRLVSVGGMRVG